MRTLICPPFADFPRGIFAGSKSGGMYLLSTFLSPMTRDSRKSHDDDEATFASSRSDIERAIQKHHLRGMNQHLFEKYETIFTSNESIRWPEKTEVNEDYLNEFKEAHRRQRSFGKFLAFHERTEENESVWFEGEYLASETHDSNRSKRRVKMHIEPWDAHEWTSR